MVVKGQAEDIRFANGSSPRVQPKDKVHLWPYYSKATRFNYSFT